MTAAAKTGGACSNPGLCCAACGSYALPQENDLICGEYIVRFRLVDWVQSVCSDRADRTLLSPAA